MPTQIIPGGAPVDTYLIVLWALIAFMWFFNIWFFVAAHRGAKRRGVKLDWSLGELGEHPLATFIFLLAPMLFGAEVLLPGLAAHVAGKLSGHAYHGHPSMWTLGSGSYGTYGLSPKFATAAHDTGFAMWVMLPTIPIFVLGGTALVLMQGFRHWLVFPVVITALIVAAHFNLYSYL